MFSLILFGLILCIANNIASAIPQIHGRIYNGFETTIEKFPHQAQLVRGTTHHCGATLVGRPGDTFTYYAITAAHCVGSEARPFRIKAGVTNRTESGQLSQVAAIYSYPSFEWQNFQGDIAVLVLENPITFNDKVKPAYLPEADSIVQANTVAFASGWGITETGKSSIMLRAAQLNVFSKEKCHQIFGSKRFTNLNLCAGGTSKPMDSCGGDSGGPLVSEGVLIGVVSWGYGCGNPDFPGIYTNVSHVRTWLDTIIRF